MVIPFSFITFAEVLTNKTKTTMGQRHQIFVKIVNPIKHCQNITPAEKRELVKEFGTKQYSILAYHNQWLYGRSALLMAMRLLKFGKQFSKEEKTTDKANGGYDCPFSPRSMYQNRSTEEITTAIAFIMNFVGTTSIFEEAGIKHSRYIGKEDEGINFDFTMGDNNDGITIIDLVENKYCFMNISTYEREQGELANSASDLPKLTPVPASAYVKAYYGETKATHNDYYTKDKTPKEVKVILDKAKKYNARVIKPFEKFEILTLKEIGKMFGTMEMFNLQNKIENRIAEVSIPKGTKITL